ncbi:butyrophilin-like protein 8 [Apus apus]|uniref:butyrophilin-like protein 8 n=1 Tax=Apus apus TaxID=8895 RepID=UPI0021F83701|nr:butyrophilin-like protein 8 [Apus apus]
MDSRWQQATTLRIIIFLQMVQLVTGQYKIIPPDKPVLGILGRGVILPCLLEAKVIPARVTIQWTFTGSSKNTDVITFNGRNFQKLIVEDEAYQGRTDIFQSEFQRGNLSLHLKNVTFSDQGKYTCGVFFDNWYDEVVVDLLVAAQGEESLVFLDGPVGQGLGLTCKSQGWFPEPKVVWLDSRGQPWEEEVTTHSIKTSSGLFDVISSTSLQPGSDQEVSCRVVNNLLNATCESRVWISDVFFPSTSPWRTASLVLLFLNLTGLAALGYKLTSSFVQWQKEGTLEAELGFWEAWSHAVPIRVNPEGQVLELQLPGVAGVESKTLDPAGPNPPCTAPVLLGEEGFGAGKHYWEVEVGEQQDWVLGVVREKGRQEGEGLLPGQDYWALHKSQGRVFSSAGDGRAGEQLWSDPVIGVLLDLEEGQVSFYGTEKKNMIVRMSLGLGKEPAGRFYPFLSKGEGALAPLIHPVSIPVPLETVKGNCASKGLQSPRCLPRGDGWEEESLACQAEDTQELGKKERIEEPTRTSQEKE